jgi:hypothetical protein
MGTTTDGDDNGDDWHEDQRQNHGHDPAPPTSAVSNCSQGGLGGARTGTGYGWGHDRDRDRDDKRGHDDGWATQDDDDVPQPPQRATARGVETGSNGDRQRGNRADNDDR